MAMNIQTGNHNPGHHNMNTQQTGPPGYPNGMNINMGMGMGMDEDPSGMNPNPNSHSHSNGQGFGSISPTNLPSRSNSGSGGMSALSALMRGGAAGGSSPTTIHSPHTPTGPMTINLGHNQHHGQNQHPMDNGMNGHYHPGQPGSFPNQPHNSPTFPSNLSPYAQPFVLPSTGGYSYSQTGIPMSLTGMGSLLNNHHNFPGSIGMGGMGLGMSISPGYGNHWNGPGGQGGQGGGAGGMSFTQMGSFLGTSRGHQMMGQGMSMGNEPNMQIGPGPAGSSVNSAMMMQHGGPGGAWGVGGERSRELEKRYVRDFTCCGLKLGGLHDLLEQ